jgi:hypothetical protein
VQHLTPAVDAKSASIPLNPGAYPREAATRFEEKAGQARDIHPLAGQDSEKMNASGWQTAAPQMIDIEAVTVTDSACWQLLEGSFGVSDLNRPPYLAFERDRTVRTVYPSPERSSHHYRQFEFQRLSHPVRAAVSQT